MDFKGYSELFHAAINRRTNRTPTTRPTAPTKFATANDDTMLVASFEAIYNNKLSKDEEKNWKWLFDKVGTFVVGRGKNAYVVLDEETRNEVKDFNLKYGSRRR